MKLLPASTTPWSKVIERRHTPQELTRKDGFTTYRSCLRWEFGFSCAFCLIHETDVSEVLGKDFMQIEHFVPKSTQEEGRNRYSNCFYICRYCNNKRGVKANLDAGGLRLLNPCSESWQQHFTLQDDQLRPLNQDAFYTETVYGLNHLNKVVIRKDRREAIDESLAVCSRFSERNGHLLAKFKETKDLEFFVASQDLWQLWKRAKKELERRDAIPGNAAPCPCGDEVCCLPDVLAEQATDLDLE
jgi:5-methylcytosine-specific restriction endonuclease McrA